MAALLWTILPSLKKQELASYVRTLLLAFDQEPPSQGATPASLPIPAPLIEPLSPQERRVLRLLVAGRSNPEMAQELVVSVIKTQVKSIYRKLNVSSRKEARNAALQMKLL